MDDGLEFLADIGGVLALHAGVVWFVDDSSSMALRLGPEAVVRARLELHGSRLGDIVQFDLGTLIDAPEPHGLEPADVYDLDPLTDSKFELVEVGDVLVQRRFVAAIEDRFVAAADRRDEDVTWLAPALAIDGPVRAVTASNGVVAFVMGVIRTQTEADEARERGLGCKPSVGEGASL